MGDEMKPQIYFLIFIYSSFFLWSCASTPVTATKGASRFEVSMLNLTLDLDKDIYKMTEPIVATLKISNISNERIVVKKRFIPNRQFLSESVRDVEFLIKDTHGNPILFNSYANVPALGDYYFTVLGPGESFDHIYSDVKAFYDISESGEYTIQVIYENQSDPKNGWVAWKGILHTNTVTFTLEP